MFLAVAAGELSSLAKRLLGLIHVDRLVLLLEGFLNDFVPLRLEHLLELAGLALQAFQLGTRLVSHALGLVCLAHDRDQLLSLALDVRLQLPVDHVENNTLLAQRVDSLTHGFVLGNGLVELLELVGETVL